MRRQSITTEDTMMHIHTMHAPHHAFAHHNNIRGRRNERPPQQCTTSEYHTIKDLDQKLYGDAP